MDKTLQQDTSHLEDKESSLYVADTLHSGVLDPEAMVSSAVPDKDEDDPSLPSLTFRVLLLGSCFSAALAFINMYYWFRSNPITLGIPVVQLLSLPLGWILSQILPTKEFNTFGWHWSLNPGPFNIKEHALISIFANASTGVAYGLDVIVARNFWIGPPLTFGPSVLLLLTSQLIGYSFSGFLHRFLVDPDAMVWPSTLVNVMLFRTLQSMVPKKGEMQSPDSQNNQFGWRKARLRMFWIAFLVSFAWYFVPSKFFTTLTMLPILCLIAPKNIYANQLGDGYHGMGMLAVSFDWSTISNSYTGSPLGTPWFAACNLFGGFVLVMWILTPICYYSNVWDAKSLPIYTSKLYNTNGTIYNVTQVLTDGNLDAAAYEAYGPMRMSFQFVLMYGFCFMGIPCLLVHVMLHYGKDVWKIMKETYGEIRHPLTAPATSNNGVYKKTPLWWYACLLAAVFAMGLAACQVYDMLPWYGFLLAIVVSAVLTLPVGMVEAVSNFQYELGAITEFIAGYIWPGQPTYNASFKVFGKIALVQALMLTKDQKLGHYMKVPPRHLFLCQILGTIIAVFVQLGAAYWLMNTVKDICTDEGFPFTCRQGRNYYSIITIWGVIGPARQFSGQYRSLYWLFLAGAFLPVPFWLLQKKYPKSFWRYVNIPLALTHIGYMPNAPTHDFVMFTLFCFIFNYVLLKYRNIWWTKYNFTLTAALDTGLAISGIIGYYALKNVHVSWWGTQNHCPLSSKPFNEAAKNM